MSAGVGRCSDSRAVVSSSLPKPRLPVTQLYEFASPLDDDRARSVPDVAVNMGCDGRAVGTIHRRCVAGTDKAATHGESRSDSQADSVTRVGSLTRLT